MSALIITVGTVASVCVICYTIRKEHSARKRKKPKCKVPEPFENKQPSENEATARAPEPVKWMCPQGHIVDMPVKVQFFADHLSGDKTVKGPEEALICPVCHSGEMKEVKQLGEAGAALREQQVQTSKRFVYARKLKTIGVRKRKGHPSESDDEEQGR